MKFNFSWRVFLVLLPIGLTSAFGQAYPQLVCDSISASKSKCGFAGFTSSALYLTRTTTTIINQVADCVTCGSGYGNPSDIGTWECVYSYDPSTCVLGDPAISGSETVTYCSGLSFPHAPRCDCFGDIISDTARHYYRSTPSPPCLTQEVTADCVLSDEYTTDLLKSNTQGALPPYPGTFTGACSAYRNLSSDESSYSIRRFRYKFAFAAVEQPFVIHWVERFTPAGNGSPSDTSRCEPISIGATESSVHEVLEPSSNGTITIEDVYIETFDANAATVTPGATPAPSHQLDPCVYGATYPEKPVDITIRACSDGANWHAILTELNGNYSLQARLLPNPSPYSPQQEVTGIGGNTTPQNFCPQVTELNALGIFCPGVWYMLQAVVAHEHVHEQHLLPALKTAAPQVETEVEGISVPDSGQSEQEAIAEIEASPAFAMAKDHAFTRWNGEYDLLWPADHTPGGPCDVEEHKVVDPMVNSICTYANNNNWGACTVCPTPVPTPPAPTANAATNVTGSVFSTSWSSVSSATGYLLDVSTSSSFTSFVSGYQNLNVGNTTSRSVTGLSANTTYYYRVRAYNGAGTSGNSNVITVATLPNPPSAPTGNAATNVTSSGFTANWSSVSGASGYRLDVSTSSSFTSYVSGYQNFDIGNIISWSVSGLSAKTVYYYRVRAYNTGGVSGNSNVISVRTKRR